MPIYEYQCDACGHQVELIQKFSDAPARDCPACGAAALRRLVSAAAFRLKGGGWYETDFKKDNRRNVSATDKPSGDNKESTPAADNKPADSAKSRSASSGE